MQCALMVTSNQLTLSSRRLSIRVVVRSRCLWNYSHHSAVTHDCVAASHGELLNVIHIILIHSSCGLYFHLGYTAYSILKAGLHNNQPKYSKSCTRSLVYKGWLMRDAFQRLLDLLEILRDEV